MSSPRVAFANSTNLSRDSRPRPFSKLSSRKSAPTCTVSLAIVSTNDLSSSILSSTSSNLSQNLIPFPSSTVDSTDPTISQPDRSCLRLLRSSSVASEPRTRASSLLSPSPERRKRSTTARLPKPATLLASESCSAPEQPPRKRPRLQKQTAAAKTTKASPINSSDLKAQAIVQRSVAIGVLARKVERTERMDEVDRGTAFFDDQDRLLANHLRSRLIAQGVKASGLVDLESELGTDLMDVDGEITVSPSLASVDMDIDVEAPIQSASMLSSPPRRSINLAPECVMSPPQLVAALIMRNHTRKTSRPSASSEWTRKKSPLAASALSVNFAVV